MGGRAQWLADEGVNRVRSINGSLGSAVHFSKQGIRPESALLEPRRCPNIVHDKARTRGVVGGCQDTFPTGQIASRVIAEQSNSADFRLGSSVTPAGL